MNQMTLRTLFYMISYVTLVGTAYAQGAVPGWMVFDIGEERAGIFDADDGGSEASPLFLGIRHDVLFSRIGFEFSKRGVSPFGVSYRGVTRKRSVNQLTATTLAVYPTFEEASRFYRAHQSRFFVSPQEKDVYRDSRYLCWGRNDTGGTVLMRCRNLVVQIGYEGNRDYVKGELFSIVDAILSDSAIARTGVFTEMPKVSNKGDMTKSPPSKDGFQTISPRIVGMGPEEDLLVRVSHSGSHVSVGKIGKSGELRMLSNDNARPSGIHLHIANLENLFVFEEIEITPTP